MANQVAAYDTIWYARKFLERLFKALTFVQTVSRDFDDKERSKGSVIEIKRPGTFVATDMPANNTDQDVTTDKMQITLDQHKGVQFGVEDKELVYSGDEIIQHHIDPAMYAVAAAIEQSMTALYKDVPWYVANDGTTPTNDFINLRKRLNDNNVPAELRKFAINYERDATYLAQALFHQANTSSQGAETQRSGVLGNKFGLETFTNPNFGNHTPGTAITGTVLTNGVTAKGASTINIDGITAGTLKKGDILVIADGQQFAVAADVGAGATMAVPVSAVVETAIPDNTGVTVVQVNKGISLAYRPEAFALVMAPLSMAGNDKGAEVGISIDKRTGLAVRVTRWYEPRPGKHMLKFDALWGRKTTDVQKAVRLHGPLV